MQNDLLRGNIQRFFISNPEAISLVEDSIRRTMRKQSILYGYINGNQSIAPSRMHLDVNINAEWVSVLSSCSESYALEMAQLDSQDLELYVASGLMPQYTTQRNNNTSYQFANFASLNYGGDANISIFLWQAREWHRAAMAIESSGSHSERKANNKLKFCSIS